METKTQTTALPEAKVERSNLSHQNNADNDDQSDSMRTYSCKFPECGKIFRYCSEIERHVVTHTNTRPFVCPYDECRKGFKRPDALATHIRTHTGDKPFKCPVGSCKLDFSTKAGLRYHVLKHKNNKIFKCDHPGCDQSFLTMSQLKQHKRATKVHDALLSPKTRTPERADALSNLNLAALQETDLKLIHPKNWTQSNRYEPAIQKRVHLEGFQPKLLAAPTQQIQQIQIFGVNLQTFNRDRLEPELGYASQRPFNFQAEKALLPRSEVLTTIQAVELPPPTQPLVMQSSVLQHPVQQEAKESYEDIKLSKETLDGQAKLLKSFSKILDENATLKKHLDICKKIIGVYQTNMGGKELSQC